MKNQKKKTKKTEKTKAKHKKIVPLDGKGSCKIRIRTNTTTLREKGIKLIIVKSSFRDKADLKKWLHETAGKTLYRPDARLITERPFQDGAGYICNFEYVKQKNIAIRVELTDDKKHLIGEFVGAPFSYSQRFHDRLECAIAQKCGLQNTKDFTYSKIIGCIENYNSLKSKVKPKTKKAKRKSKIQRKLQTENASLRKNVRWSPITTKQKISTHLRLPSVYRLNRLCKDGTYEIKKAGSGKNRQAWQIRIDTLPTDLQKKFTP